MARKTFFSFHFDNDIWRANQVRNCNVVAGADVAGFFDHSEYEEAKKQGQESIKKMILRHLDNTSVTVVLIGSQTASRPWVQYEIEQSLKRKNGLVGIHISHLLDRLGRASTKGQIPQVPYGTQFPVYDWDKDLTRLNQTIEAAGKHSDRLNGRRL